MEYLDRIINRHLNQSVNKTLTRINEQRGKSRFNADEIANDIYNAKGYVFDDPDQLVTAIKKIKNVADYAQVTRKLQKLTKGKGIGSYIHSFISNAGFLGKDKSTKYKIVSHLMRVIPKKHWEWTVKTIITWEDVKQLVRQRTGTKDVQIPKDIALMVIQKDKGILRKLLSDPDLFAAEAGTIEAEMGREDVHEGLMGLQIVTGLMGLGPIAVGLGLVDAELYRREGNNYMAGLMAVFSLLPGGSRLAQKIPGINKLGKSGMANLARKIVSKRKLTPDERIVAGELSKNTKLLNQEADQLLNQQIKKNAPNIKSAPSNVKANASSTLTNLAKKGFKFAGTAGLYLYGIPAAYGAVYNKLDPPVAQQDIDGILGAAEARLQKRILRGLKAGLAAQSANPVDKATGAIRSIGATIGKTISGIAGGKKSKKQESVNPINEAPPSIAPGGGGMFDDLTSYILSLPVNNSTIAVAGLIAAAMGLPIIGRIIRTVRGKTGGATGASAPFRWTNLKNYRLPFNRQLSRLPAMQHSEWFLALRDLRNLRNIKVPDGKGGFTTVNVTRSMYNNLVTKLETSATKSIDEINALLLKGKITPKQALLDYRSIQVGRFTETLESYIEQWEKGQAKIKKSGPASKKSGSEKSTTTKPLVGLSDAEALRNYNWRSGKFNNNPEKLDLTNRTSVNQRTRAAAATSKQTGIYRIGDKIDYSKINGWSKYGESSLPETVKQSGSWKTKWPFKMDAADWNYIQVGSPNEFVAKARYELLRNNPTFTIQQIMSFKPKIK